VPRSRFTRVGRITGGVLAALTMLGTASVGAAAASPNSHPSHRTSLGGVSTGPALVTTRLARPVCAAALKPDEAGVSCSIVPSAGLTSGNWSGYRVAAGGYTSITGTWTIASTSGSGESSTWIGIDGIGNNAPLIQIGTQSWSGEVAAWWQILPQDETEQGIDMNVRVGDRMYASITKACGSSNLWTMTLIDQTESETFTIGEQYNGPGATAEWIMEAPTQNGSQTSLVHYSTFDFSQATVNGSSPHLTWADSMTMVQGGNIVSTPGGTDMAGDSFGMIYGSAFLLGPPNMLGYVGSNETFQPIDTNDIYVLGSDRKLWLETGPWNTNPPHRTYVDQCVRAFEELGTTQALVLGLDGNLWLENAPFGSMPPAHRSPVDGNVEAFQSVGGNMTFVLGTDGKLWLETAPYGPSHRIQIDSGVESFQAIGPSEALVLFTNGNLVLLNAPAWGSQPVAVDGNVDSFQATNIQSDTSPPPDIYVLGSDGNLWDEFGAYGPAHRTWVDSSVRRFQVLDSEQDMNYPTQVFVVYDNGSLAAEPDGNYYNSSPLIIDNGVQTAVPIDAYYLVSLDADGSTLWLETTPWGTAPYDWMDANVAY
jgi:hypothetical protein